MKRIFIKLCPPSRFAESTFSGQTSLELLQLSNNRMETITTTLFNELINLFRLSLPNNRIELIEDGALSHCAQLRKGDGTVWGTGRTEREREDRE